MAWRSASTQWSVKSVIDTRNGVENQSVEALTLVQSTPACIVPLPVGCDIITKWRQLSGVSCLEVVIQIERSAQNVQAVQLMEDFELNDEFRRVGGFKCRRLKWTRLCCADTQRTYSMIVRSN